jgi:hypothetical protein
MSATYGHVPIIASASSFKGRSFLRAAFQCCHGFPTPATRIVAGVFLQSDRESPVESGGECLRCQAAVTRQVDVMKERPDSPSEEFLVVEPWTTWPYQGPGLNLAALSVGPETVAAAAFAHWPTCAIRGLTLGKEGPTLLWWIFCDLSEGLEALGTLDVQAREFRPGNAMPAFRPPTATPLPTR